MQITTTQSSQKMGMIQAVLLGIGIIGNITCMALYLSPIPTFKRIIKEKDTGQFSAFTYVCSLFKCLLWTLYGLPIITDNNITIATMNGIGIAFEMVYVLIYLVYAPQAEKIRVGAMEAASLTSFFVLAACVVTVVPKSRRSLILGVFCVALNILMYAAPLSVLIPNGLGVLLGTIQIIVFYIYTKDPKISTKVEQNGNNKIVGSHQNGICKLTEIPDMV
ncbi:bidirectional sugar transporter SWEET7b-like isoform X2 [Cryptomeria japonica]|uniref:bidirectional sugar transporter SWEET7b-like isoform X2 n=1 Tax=Cryptomeria japonica TaxID=3369 RepID=UPI0025AC579A|nr:bidirectional sugar transporter SWEET7b-like isoform X2 [Cryptomeria japonica]